LYCAKYPCGQDLDYEISWLVSASVSWILYIYILLVSDPVLSCDVDVSVVASGCRLKFGYPAGVGSTPVHERACLLSHHV
jgi:hypothetical protein